MTSTTGGHLCIAGPDTHFPMHALSSIHDSIATSAQEAETVADNTVCASESHLCHRSFGNSHTRLGLEGVTREDNEAAARVMTTGRTPTMKRTPRVHGVGVSSIHETVGRHGRAVVGIRYCPADGMNADICTPPFTSAHRYQHALSLIGIVSSVSPTLARVPCEVVPPPARRKSGAGRGTGRWRWKQE